MKKETKKILTLGLAAIFGLSILTGCGANAQSQAPVAPPAPVEEPAPPEIYPEEPMEEPEIYEEEPMDGALEEAPKMGATDFANEPEEPMDGAYEEELMDGEPAEGLSDQVLMTGYYGAWKGETKYMFGVLSEKDFMINVVGATSPILYAEGELKDNGDGTYTANITSSDNAFAEGKSFLIKALGGPDISMSADDAELNDALSGSYTYAGEKAADVESLK